MFCTACATHNPPTSDSCQSCGAKLARENSAQEPASRPNSRRMKSVFFILPVVMILLAGGFVAQHVRAERIDAENAYHRAEDALASGDYESAIADFADAGSYRDA